MATLAEQALDFVRRNPRRNPPEPGEIEDRVNGFCIEKKTEGEALGQWDEEEWRSALENLGVADFELSCYLEDVASWGVDD